MLAKLNGHEIRALIDTGSMADFISTMVAEQLNVPKTVYEKPISVQLAVQGSRSKINCGTAVRFQYQSIDCKRRFDIVNLDNYDAILGTPFLSLGTNDLLPGEDIVITLGSLASCDQNVPTDFRLKTFLMF